MQRVSADARFDAATVRRAVVAFVGRVLGGGLTGIAAGATAFAVEKGAGQLPSSGLVWVLLPVYLAVGAGGLGIAGALLGKRRAVTILLVDSGVLARLVELVRAAAGRAGGVLRAATDAATADPDVQTGRRLSRWVKRRAYGRIAQVLDGEGAASAEEVAARLADDLAGGLLGPALAVAAVAAAFAIAPLAG